MTFIGVGIMVKDSATSFHYNSCLAFNAHTDRCFASEILCVFRGRTVVECRSRTEGARNEAGENQAEECGEAARCRLKMEQKTRKPNEPKMARQDGEPGMPVKKEAESEQYNDQ